MLLQRNRGRTERAELSTLEHPEVPSRIAMIPTGILPSRTVVPCYLNAKFLIPSRSGLDRSKARLARSIT